MSTFDREPDVRLAPLSRDCDIRIVSCVVDGISHNFAVNHRFDAPAHEILMEIGTAFQKLGMRVHAYALREESKTSA